MDGNIFFSNRFDSSSEAIINFVFDLQRFEDTDTGKTAEELEDITDATEKAKYTYEVTTTSEGTTTVKYYNSLSEAEKFADDGTIAMTVAPTTAADKAAFLYEARPGNSATAIKYFKTFAEAETYCNPSETKDGVGNDFSYVAYLTTDEATAISQGYTVSATMEGGTTKYFNDIRYAFDYVKSSSRSSITKSTINVLADIPNAKGFRSGSRYVNTTINLNGHTVTFITSIQGDRKTKAMQFDKYSTVTINGGNGTAGDNTVGTMTIVPQDMNGKFERFIRCYCDLTINNVTLDATNLLQGTGMDSAAIQTSCGKLSLVGNTSVIVKEDDAGGTYYAITGTRQPATGTLKDGHKIDYPEGFQIEIDTTSETPIKNVALATWTDSETVPASTYTSNTTTTSGSETTTTKASPLVIKQGKINDVAVSEKTNETSATETATTVEVTGEDGETTTKTVTKTVTSAFDLVQITPSEEGKTVTIGETTYTSADVDPETGTVDEDKAPVVVTIPGSGTDDGSSSVQKAVQIGWNDGSFLAENRWFYVVKDGDNAQVVITADGANNSSVFGGVDTDNKVAAIPANIDTSVTADSGYHVVKTNYYSGRKRVGIAFDASVTIQSDKLFDDSVVTIDSSANVAGAKITGNSLANEIRGGRGDSLFGGEGNDLFVYIGGNNQIGDYATGDSIKVSGINIVTDGDKFQKVGTDSKDFEINFGNEAGKLSITGGATVANGVTVLAGNNKTPYIYRSNFIDQGMEGVTLTSYYAGLREGAISLTSSNTSMKGNIDEIREGDERTGIGSYDLRTNRDDPVIGYIFQDINNYKTINAAAVSKPVSIEGDHNNNTITGSSANSSSIHGGSGNDLLIGSSQTSDVFKYSMGNDVIENYQYNEAVGEGEDATTVTDALVINTRNIKSAKSSKKKFAVKLDSKNSLTFKTEDYGITKISLQGGGFLTKDGTASLSGGNNKLTLFEGTRGKIDLLEDSVYAGSKVASVDASASKSPVTLIADNLDGAFTFATNKKKDTFQYNGGNISISGYEAGKDKFDLNIAAFGTFSVGTDDTNVSLSGTGNDVVVLEAMKGEEILLHHADSKHRNSFQKMVFKQDGVILNKKRPTSATITANDTEYDFDDESTVKRVFLADSITGASIVASNKTKTTLDASAAGKDVTLVGGEKNDKLIGSTSTVEGAGDTFVYTGGKDIIQNYGSSDNISISGFASEDSILSAKINAGKRSIKLKFSNKDALTVKPTKGSTLDGSLNIKELNGYTYAKNAVISGSNASLTSEFSGSYRLKNSKATVVDGSRVEKNLTYKGTSSAETLSGGEKKTTFKGGGGKDSLKGGSGNDIFFYAKGDKGDATIADFDFNKDKLKIASGTITKITVNSGAIEFDMNSGKKGSANIGSFTIGNIIGGYDAGKTVAAPDKTVIKANNTYYWFAEGPGKDANGDAFADGALITSVNRVSKSDTTGYAVIDLGYSSNLVNAGVAYKTELTLPKISNPSGDSSDS